MIPRITVSDSLETAIVTRALVDYARKMIGEAGEADPEIATRLSLITTARKALELAESLTASLPNMPAEFPAEYDAELLVWLKSMR